MGEHGVPEAGQLLEVWTKGRREKRICQEPIAGQCSMRSEVSKVRGPQALYKGLNLRQIRV